MVFPRLDERKHKRRRRMQSPGGRGQHHAVLIKFPKKLISFALLSRAT
jgi:hypothetical protein